MSSWSLPSHIPCIRPLKRNSITLDRLKEKTNKDKRVTLFHNSYSKLVLLSLPSKPQKSSLFVRTIQQVLSSSYLWSLFTPCTRSVVVSVRTLTDSIWSSPWVVVPNTKRDRCKLKGPRSVLSQIDPEPKKVHWYCLRSSRFFDFWRLNRIPPIQSDLPIYPWLLWRFLVTSYLWSLSLHSVTLRLPSSFNSDLSPMPLTSPIPEFYKLHLPSVLEPPLLRSLTSL